MVLSRLLLIALFLEIFELSLFSQSIEIFVEPGVDIVGHPSNRKLDFIDESNVGITKDGHVLFVGISSIEFFPGQYFPARVILLAEIVNEVDYLIGDGFPIGGNFTLNFSVELKQNLYFNH
jgi:hypothetical protein